MKNSSGLAIVIGLALGSAQAADIGDPVKGAEVFEMCQSCHDLGENARNKVGPHLNELFGRRAGGVPEFDYSQGLVRAGVDGLIWDRDKLDLYIENPKILVSDTIMMFDGLDDVQERRDLLAFLRGYSASPANIPESQPTAYARDPDVDPTVLAIKGDPDYGAYLAGECVTCHQADGDQEGIPSITGWPNEDFVTAMHAYKIKARVHPVMQMVAGRLNNEEIAGLAAYFATLE